ncbi:Photosystem I reaction center subunit VI, chloroplastic [Sesamum alatum]|uniref:Photosystem I reaction center subunit VI n=1 Tax=Sesamum alatum TaxID=300844 RepID=A0AAE1YGR5_9LAMI|nr:Photosystem I reaction center subunit VI, chloroplastic [Sesamum alatum]
MASIAIFAAHPTAVKGLIGNSLARTKLHLKPSRVNSKPTNYRAGALVAKYGDKSVYFDLEDIDNTIGQWNLYGSDAPSPYNPLQSKFFETFAAPFTKRGLLLKFLILGNGINSCLCQLASNPTNRDRLKNHNPAIPALTSV